jgi:mono/diheme cytochrome c family protein
MNSLLTAVRFSRIGALFALAAPLPLLLLSAPANSADPNQGQRLFERRCTGCHRLDEVRSGPRLRGASAVLLDLTLAFPIQMC